MKPLDPLWQAVHNEAEIGELQREEEEALGLTEEELHPKNWSLSYYEVDCGHACTPNGCTGHSSSILETLEIGGYALTLADELSSNTDSRNRIKLGLKLKEVMDFYIAHHP